MDIDCPVNRAVWGTDFFVTFIKLSSESVLLCTLYGTKRTLSANYSDVTICFIYWIPLQSWLHPVLLMKTTSWWRQARQLMHRLWTQQTWRSYRNWIADQAPVTPRRCQETWHNPSANIQKHVDWSSILAFLSTPVLFRYWATDNLAYFSKPCTHAILLLWRFIASRVISATGTENSKRDNSKTGIFPGLRSSL